MKVLSLFDGISCGMVALERAGIKIDEYMAYEIDEYATKVSEKNYPNIKRGGDVFDAKYVRGGVQPNNRRKSLSGFICNGIKRRT